MDQSRLIFCRTCNRPCTPETERDDGVRVSVCRRCQTETEDASAQFRGNYTGVFAEYDEPSDPPLLLCRDPQLLEAFLQFIDSAPADVLDKVPKSLVTSRTSVYGVTWVQSIPDPWERQFQHFVPETLPVVIACVDGTFIFCSHECDEPLYADIGGSG